jgi:ABC-type phosphate/phosphonate transport system substrate-binding protein
MKRTNGSAVVFMLVVALFFIAQPALAAPPVYIGVLAKRGVEKAIQQWGPTAEYLSGRLERDVRIIPLAFTEIEPALKDRKIDFLLANSAYYARFEDKYGLDAILTLGNRKGQNALDEFGGVLFTRKGSNINNLKDVKGSTFMCVEYSSFGGAHMVWRLLLEHGIDPKKDCKAFLEGKTHDNVVMAVKDGVVDVGTVRSDTLERMADEGKIDMHDFTVISPVSDGFPFVHSTVLYPEWPLAACAHVSPEMKKNVARLLYVLNSKHPALEAAKVFNWKRPANYAEVTACLKVIGVM